MDRRRARERKIAAVVAHELYWALRPAMEAGANAETLVDENRSLVAHVFGTVCQRHQHELANEAAIARVWAYVPKAVADLRRHIADLNRRLDSAAASASTVTIDEHRIATELAAELAGELSVVWETGGHRGAFDRGRVNEILGSTLARHGITTAAQADRIFEIANPLILDMRRKFYDDQIEDAPRPVFH